MCYIIGFYLPCDHFICFLFLRIRNNKCEDLLCVFPLNGETRFLLRKNIFLKRKLESPLIFVYFFKGKQNKK